MRQDIPAKTERPDMPAHISIRILESDADWQPREKAARQRFFRRLQADVAQPTLNELDLPHFIPIDASRATNLVAYDAREKGPPNKSGKRIIGMVIVAPRAPERNEAFPDSDLVLSTYGVIPDEEYRGKGIGAYLLHHALEIADEKSKGGPFRRLILETDLTTSESAKELYRSFGFKEEPILQQPVQGIQMRRHLYTKRLK